MGCQSSRLFQLKSQIKGATFDLFKRLSNGSAMSKSTKPDSNRMAVITEAKQLDVIKMDHY